MAYSFGGGVRPELGRTDYGAVARGGEMQAQLSAQGSQMMAQGLAKALEGAGKAVANYQERKETNKIFDGTVDDLMKANTDSGGALAKQLAISDPTDKKAWSVGLQSLAPDKRTSALMGRQLFKQYYQQQEQRKAMANALAPVVTARRTPIGNQIMTGGRFENLSFNPADFVQEVDSRPPTSGEFLQRALGSGMAEGPAAAIHQSLVSAELAGVPKPPRDDRTTLMKEYDAATKQGYKGTFLNYVKELDAAKGAAIRPVLTPEEQQKVSEMSMRSKAAFEANEEIIKAGGTARNNIRKIEQITSLLDEGLKTGFAAGWILKTKQLGKRLGIEGLETANAEQAQVLFGDFVMSRVQETKGAISNKEMDLFAEMSPGLLKTPEGNRQIIAFIKEADERTQDLSKKVRGWRESGDSEPVIRAKVEHYQDENPLSIVGKKQAGVPKGITQEEWNAMSPKEKSLFTK